MVFIPNLWKVSIWQMHGFKRRVCVCVLIYAVVPVFSFPQQLLSPLLAYRVLIFPHQVCVFVLQISLSIWVC